MVTVEEIKRELEVANEKCVKKLDSLSEVKKNLREGKFENEIEKNWWIAEKEELEEEAKDLKVKKNEWEVQLQKLEIALTEKHTDKDFLTQALEEVLSCIPPPVTYSPKCTISKTKKVNDDPLTNVMLWDDFFDEVNRFRFDQQPRFERPQFIRDKVVLSEEDVRLAIDVNICMAYGARMVFLRQPTHTPGISDFNCYSVELLILVIEKMKHILEDIDERTFPEFYQPNEKARMVIQEIYNYMGANELRYDILSTYDNHWFLRRKHTELWISNTLEYAYLARQANDNPNSLHPLQVALLIKSTTNLRHLDGSTIIPQTPLKGRGSKTLLCEFRGYMIALKSVDLAKAPPYVLEEMQKEVEIYKDLADIQGKYIPKLVCYGYYGGVMSFVIGMTIVGTALTKVKALKALEAVHNHDILQNDIREEKILINDSGDIYLEWQEQKLLKEEQLKLSHLLDSYTVSSQESGSPTNTSFSTAADRKALPSNQSLNDTIFALSSAHGKAGVAVIRVSGVGASEAIEKLAVKNAKFPIPRIATPRSILHPNTREVLDYGLVIWFPGPNSYTGEDVVEFHIHGGTAVVSGVLEALSSVRGFRYAGRGEFTRRAFDNNKLDLTEIEGLADLLNAETEVQRRQALRQAQGGLRNLYEKWRKELIENMALVEAVIDFGEEENIEDGVRERASENVQRLMKDISEHINDNRRGEILRNGIYVTLLGPPNSGKSSFLNSLAQRQAAIVSSIPGTTRDVVDVSLNIGGYPIVLGDTAGLRETDDEIELEGMKRARDRILSSDINICILSLPELITKFKEANDFRSSIGTHITDSVDEGTLVILNKLDLVKEAREATQLREKLVETLGLKLVWEASCKTGQGLQIFLDQFIRLIKHKFDSSAGQQAIITQFRHRKHLNECLESLKAYLETEEIVLAAEELRHAVNAIGKITGRVDVEEVLGLIFQQFCIGK
ncbi:hypothetical protein G9A89_008912 [Geosiphon pyriformis]|nr:hypothetical protein G9A89_008912 [Geosiphon pyriformis]